MGKAKNMWTLEEEAALVAGVNSYGIGKWKEILNDPNFAYILRNRSNVDLKDKSRNMKLNEAVCEQPGMMNATTNNKLRLVIIIIAIVALLWIGKQPTVLCFFEIFLKKSWRFYKLIKNMKENVQVHGMV